MMTRALLLLLCGTSSAVAFVANISVSPNPSTGDYTVSWSNPAGTWYNLEALPAGGSWASVAWTNGISWAKTGQTPGDFGYRLKQTETQCSGWPEPFCFDVTTYSETATVTVSAAPPPPGPNPDPDSPPPSFAPPSAAEFPDAAIVNPAVPPSDNNPSVGAVQGSGGVTGGQASYRMPIVVAPGRKGMQPTVSLSYSSAAGSGVVGVGWHLSAGSAISRCAATVAQDGFTAAVQYDAVRDRLCLDGQRLMVVSGVYGQSGAQYRTELDRFARISQSGPINGTVTSFTVEYKNGNTSRFGLDASARHVATGRSETMTWAISDTQDPSGNTISYDYASYGNGEVYLDSIHYSGFNGADGDRHVRFEYLARPDARSAYLAGGKTRSTQRLSKIVTQYQLTTIRDYTLSYGALSASTGRSVLRSVKECAYLAGQAWCLPETVLTWQEQAPQYVTERLQFSSGGIPAIVHADKRWLHDVLPHGDENGDGVKDWTDLYVNAEGEVTGTHTVSLSNCFKPPNGWTLTCLEADFDADGLTDSFRRNNDKFEIKFADSSVWINTGVDWATNGLPPEVADTPLGFADFNGDGWVDIAFKQNSQLWIYFHTTNLAAPYSSVARQWVLAYPSSATTIAHTIDVQLYGDLDGNGTPDLVVSTIPDSAAIPGLPTPNYIVLTHSQTGGAMTTSTRSVPAYTKSGGVAGVSVNANFFHDINGDGLPDLVSLVEDTLQLQYRLNTGLDFGTAWTGLGATIPTRENQYELTTGEPAVAAYPIMSRILVMDYDGDGRQEILTANTVLASGCAEVLQAPPAGNVWLCDDALYGEYQAAQYASTGAPINSAVKDDSVRSFTGYRFDEDAAGIIVATAFATGIKASASQTAVIDATGDGLPDVVTVLGCRFTACEFNTQTAGRTGTVQNAAYVEGAWINRNIGTASGGQRFEGYDLMSAVQNGLGIRNEWTYRPLSSDEYNTANSDFYRTTHSDEAASADYFHFASSMYVVADHRASNGIGGLNSTQYRYRGAIFNNKGRGFQGFKSIIVEQDIYDDTHPLANTDKITRTDFHQKWPLSSQPIQACTWIGAGHAAAGDDNPNCSNVISMSTTNSIHDVATAGGARFVAIDSQTARVYDLNGTHALLTTQTTALTFDSAGNVIYESRSHSDDWSTNLTETSSSYTLDWVGWWLNKLGSRVIKHNPVSQRHATSPAIAPGSDALKQVTTGFSTYDATHRLPTSVTVSGNDTALTQTVTTQYNAYGLPTVITTTGTGVTGPRTVTTTYANNGFTQSVDGYFPFTVTNGLGHQAKQHTDPSHGQPSSQWDANDLLTSTAYDAFGRVAEVTPPGSPTAYQRYFWCGGAVSCPAGASYKIATLSAGAPEANSYVDQLGREIQSSVKNFGDSSFVNVSISYDERGNQTFVSQPYDLAIGESASIGTRFLSFDALGRLQSKEIDQAAGTIFLTAYSFTGLKTSINAAGLTMSRTYNGLEQLVETVDARGGFTRYAYDGAGNPIVLQDPNGNSITASFNALGHKQWVIDPNMGLKDFSYSALGEVLAATDANGDTVSMVYDVLGRLTDRLVNNDLVGKWYYDNPGTYKGLGLLDYEDSQFGPDGSRLQKFYFYRSSGNKHLLQVTHRFYRNADPNDFTDYATEYFSDNFYGRPKGLRYPGGTGLAFEYNSAGFVSAEKDPGSGYVYRQINARDSRNQVTQSTLTNGLLSYAAGYYAASGQMQQIAVTNGASLLHDFYYEYGTFGNLDFQRTTYSGATSSETFLYDELQRLTESRRSINGGAAQIVNYSYDAAGNLMLKSDYASSYTYNPSRPNAVASVTLAGGGSVNFAYDGNGNMTAGHNKSLIYNAFNKPVSITRGGINSTFTYGADLSRYRQVKSTGETTLYLDKLMEIVTVGTSTDYRHYISDVAILTKTGDLNDPNPGIEYLHRDRLGSLVTITDKNGLNAQARGFDPFGKPRDGNWADRTPATLNSSITDRGFTEHEHLDDFELIHMNGRAYDYNLGRFLSVDPFIQAPGNSQSLNPYSYIMNNPLAGTDPSGYASEEEVEKVAVTGSRIKRDPGTVQNVGGQFTVAGTRVDLPMGAGNPSQLVTANGGSPNANNGRIQAAPDETNSPQQTTSQPTGVKGDSENTFASQTDDSIYEFGIGKFEGISSNDLQKLITDARNRLLQQINLSQQDKNRTESDRGGAFINNKKKFVIFGRRILSTETELGNDELATKIVDRVFAGESFTIGAVSITPSDSIDGLVNSMTRLSRSLRAPIFLSTSTKRFNGRFNEVRVLETFRIIGGEGGKQSCVNTVTGESCP